MSKPFIFINTYAIRPGKEEEYKKAFQEVAQLVEAEEPQMLYFACHVSENGDEVTTVQVHADADNLIHHMKLAEEHIDRAMRDLLDTSEMRIQIYGTPSDALLDQMRQVAGSGVSVTVSPATVAFNRFPEP
jgi:quinol monooxygenase YgiN